jgi:hypothetical protein
MLKIVMYRKTDCGCFLSRVSVFIIRVSALGWYKVVQIWPGLIFFVLKTIIAKHLLAHVSLQRTPLRSQHIFSNVLGASWCPFQKRLVVAACPLPNSLDDHAVHSPRALCPLWSTYTTQTHGSLITLATPRQDWTGFNPSRREGRGCGSTLSRSHSCCAVRLVYT